MSEQHRILFGDCIEVMRTLPDESVHACVASLPYYGKRICQRRRLSHASKIITPISINTFSNSSHPLHFSMRSPRQ